MNNPENQQNIVNRAAQEVSGRTSIIGELLHFLWARKLWWLIPLIIVLMFIGIAFIFLQSAIAPFIYTVI